MRVDEMGGHGLCFSPGGKSLVMAGMLGARNTSQLSEVFRVVRLVLDVLVLDCPCLERDSSALISEGKPIMKAVPSASAKISRLEVIMALSDRISLSLLLLLVPLICKYHRRPAIPTPLLVQSTQ